MWSFPESGNSLLQLFALRESLNAMPRPSPALGALANALERGVVALVTVVVGEVTSSISLLLTGVRTAPFLGELLVEFFLESTFDIRICMALDITLSKMRGLLFVSSLSIIVHPVLTADIRGLVSNTLGEAELAGDAAAKGVFGPESSLAPARLLDRDLTTATGDAAYILPEPLGVPHN